MQFTNGAFYRIHTDKEVLTGTLTSGKVDKSTGLLTILSFMDPEGTSFTVNILRDPIHSITKVMGAGLDDFASDYAKSASAFLNGYYTGVEVEELASAFTLASDMDELDAAIEASCMLLELVNEHYGRETVYRDVEDT